VSAYGDSRDEYRLLKEGCGILDMSARSRLCVVGPDKSTFLHGQVTNQVKQLNPGQGCYAALLNVKGKMESDMNIWMLNEEILLDFEPGMAEKVIPRLLRYIIAEDVDVVEVGDIYRQITLCGPRSAEVLSGISPAIQLPESHSCIQPVYEKSDTLGEAYIATQKFGNGLLHNLFVPVEHHLKLLESLIESARSRELGGLVGQVAFETLRVELGVPRFGIEMDESNLPPEVGLDKVAVSYNKGCYIGQEIIARMRTYGQASKKLCGFRFSGDLKELPEKNTPVWCGEKRAGNLVNSVHSLALGEPIAMGYLKKQFLENAPSLEIKIGERIYPLILVTMPFC